MNADLLKIEKNGVYKPFENENWISHIDENGIEWCERPKDYYARESARLLEQSGISEAFSKKSFVNFKTGGNPELAEAKEKAQRFYSGFRGRENDRQNSILFCGQPGSGKTHLGMAISHSLMKEGVAVLYMPYRDAVTRAKQVMTDQAYQKEMQRYKNARVLFIDDLLKGRVTDSDVNILYEIINDRYLKQKPMIISTEKTVKELLEYDEAIGSRILEMSKGHIIQFEGIQYNRRLAS